jgi:hypothetical protein
LSDQHKTGTDVILDLEELFLSREFGRRPARTVSSASAAVESASAQLEQVFRSELFGRPEVLEAATVAIGAPAAARRPALVLINGDGEGGFEHDSGRARAIAAVSGVAAAALAVAGLASGTGHGTGRPASTQLAQGPLPSRAVPGSGDGTLVPLSPSGTGTPLSPDTLLTSFSVPGASAVPHGQSGGGATIAPAAPATLGGASSPGTPPSSGGAGGGGMLTPALDAVGIAVSGVGSTVTSASGGVGQTLPVSSVGQALGIGGASAANNLGGDSPPNNLAGVLKE